MGVGLTCGITREPRAGVRAALVAVAVGIALVLLFCSNGVVGASPAVSPAEELDDRRDEAIRIQVEVAELDHEISLLVEDFDRAQYFWELSVEAEGKAHELSRAAERDLADAQARLGARLRDVYMLGPTSALDLLLTSSDLSQLVERTRYLGDLLQGDRRVQQEVEAHGERLRLRARELERETARREQTARALADRRASVETKLVERSGILNGLEQDIARLVAEEKAREEARARAEAERAEKAARETAAREDEARQAAAAAAGGSDAGAARTVTTIPSSAPTASPPARGETVVSPSSTTTPPTKPPAPAPTADTPAAPSSIGDQVVAVAKRYLGVPYVWGGASPRGFDCSGLTQFVLAQLGVQLPHSSGLQYLKGKPVPRQHLAPGDLVFFGQPVHHVGIYIGGGQYLHAPYTGELVKISPFARSDYVGARRF